MAGAAGLEPVTSAVTGQRSNQLSYAPAQVEEIRRCRFPSQRTFQKIRAADAKEVGVENPAEETYYRPNQIELMLVFSWALSIQLARGQIAEKEGEILLKLVCLEQLFCFSGDFAF
jgi:hypothetical protein